LLEKAFEHLKKRKVSKEILYEKGDMDLAYVMLCLSCNRTGGGIVGGEIYLRALMEMHREEEYWEHILGSLIDLIVFHGKEQSFSLLNALYERVKEYHIQALQLNYDKLFELFDEHAVKSETLMIALSYWRFHLESTSASSVESISRGYKYLKKLLPLISKDNAEDIGQEAMKGFGAIQESISAVALFGGVSLKNYANGMEKLIPLVFGYFGKLKLLKVEIHIWMLQVMRFYIDLVVNCIDYVGRSGSEVLIYIAQAIIAIKNVSPPEFEEYIIKFWAHIVPGEKELKICDKEKLQQLLVVTHRYISSLSESEKSIIVIFLNRDSYSAVKINILSFLMTQWKRQTKDVMFSRLILKFLRNLSGDPFLQKEHKTLLVNLINDYLKECPQEKKHFEVLSDVSEV
jgi:hypothetical protein